MKINHPITQQERPFPKNAYIVSRTDLKGLITYANDAFIEVSGFSRQELIGKSHNIVRHPDVPAAAFDNLWSTVKDGRPWRGIVKNRCKNGDHYWVDALVVPVRRDNQTIGYMSVRTEPSRAQIRAAEAAYPKINAGRVKLPVPTPWARIPLKAKLASLTVLIVAAQALCVLCRLFGADLGLSAGTVNHLLEGGGIVTVAAGIGLLLQQREIMAAIDRIVGRIDHIAQGNLTDEIALSRADELGRLDDGVVTMQTHLKAMMAEIAEVAGSVREDADSLSRRSEQTRQAAQRQSEATGRIAAAVEELAASVSEVADNAGHAAQAVDQSRLLLAAASSRMEDSRAASRNVVTTVEAAGDTMSELFKSIAAIDQISQAIREIAEQTNLLALNAAIEAARAGESGRGFAVVADEVRKLAEKASQQTEHIGASVREIQRVTQLAVAGMESAGSHVSATDQAMTHAQAGLADVASHGDSVLSMSQLIAEATQQQSQAGNEMAAQVEGIVAELDETSAAISQVSGKAGELKQTALQLQELIGYFRYIK
ncbi:MAG TPA: PAS domain-containing methyl-accepting chemotaxis protein [Rhodocyclaceae bacterium]|nr:PAS domain-containing methyl-accepting chemotaxis protein [Rhodocyclaceae bacterium]